MTRIAAGFQNIEECSLHGQALYQAPIYPSPQVVAPFIPEGARYIQLKAGEVIIIAGPNGVGKSALLDEIYRSTKPKSDRLTGFRQIHFQSSDVEDVGFNLEDLLRNLGDQRSFSRYRNHWSEQHLKSYMRRFKDSELQALADTVSDQENGASLLVARDKNPSPLKRLNSVLAVGKLPVSIVVADGTIKATRGEEPFSIDRMSDGERAALLMVASTLIQPTGNCLLIDEPERHLNPAIAAPLIAAMVRTRPDLAFVFSSHDVALIEALRPNTLLHLRESRIVSDEPEVREYDINELVDADTIPADLKAGLIGSRRALLLTEGTDVSDDRALYSQVYEGWHVLARGGNQTVTADVPAINQQSQYAWLNVCGLVDGDGRTREEKLALSEKHIHSLPCPTIENLFFIPGIIEEMAELIAELEGGQGAPDRIAAAYNTAKEELVRSRSNIIDRRVTWQANRLLSERKVSVKSIGDGQKEIESIDLLEIRRKIEREFDDDLASQSPPDLLFSLPIKNSGVTNAAAKALGYKDFRQYKSAVLAQIERGSERGKRLLSTLRNVLPRIEAGS